MPEIREKKDWSPLAVAGGLAVLGAGLYYYFKGEEPPTEPPPEEPPEEGDWLPASAELASELFSFTVKPPEEGDWMPASAELANRPFSFTVKPPEEGDWMPANAELANRPFSFTVEKPPAEYTLTTKVEPAGVGWVTKDPNKPKYEFGEIVDLYAVKDPFIVVPYVFDIWTSDGEWLGSTNPLRNYMVTRDATLTAHFRSLV